METEACIRAGAGSLIGRDCESKKIIQRINSADKAICCLGKRLLEQKIILSEYCEFQISSSSYQQSSSSSSCCLIEKSVVPDMGYMINVGMLDDDVYESLSLLEQEICALMGSMSEFELINEDCEQQQVSSSSFVSSSSSSTSWSSSSSSSSVSESSSYSFSSSLSSSNSYSDSWSSSTSMSSSLSSSGSECSFYSEAIAITALSAQLVITNTGSVTIGVYNISSSVGATISPITQNINPGDSFVFGISHDSDLSLTEIYFNTTCSLDQHTELIPEINSSSSSAPSSSAPL